MTITILKNENAIPNFIQELKDRQEHPELWRGLSFNHPELDELTGGARRQEVIAIGGPQKVGKTTAAISISLEFAKQIKELNKETGEDEVVMFASLEESVRSLLTKSISNLSGIEMRKFRDLKLTNTDWKAITPAANRLEGLPIVWLSNGNTIEALETALKKIKTRVLVIDYFTLMWAKGFGQRWEQHEYNSAQLVRLAKDYNLTIIVLAQRTREGNTNMTKRIDPNEMAGGQALPRDVHMLLIILPVMEKGVEIPNLREIYVALSRNSAALETFDAVLAANVARFGAPATTLNSMPEQQPYWET